jgi:hypothetical protein
MARSTYVYVAVVTSQIEPVATFTVKHELVRWLTGLERQDSPVLSDLRVFRMDDGPEGMKAEIPVGELLASSP